MNTHKILNVLIRPFRKRRMNKFIKLLHPTPKSTILDVGGTPFNWRLVKGIEKVTLLNLTIPENVDSDSRRYSFVEGDGTDLKYPDSSFDILFSNSVIEHLSTHENQKKFAAEAGRVGKSLWVQTPAKEFFVEPHFITPFIHYFPKSWQKRLVRNCSVWGLLTRPSQKQIDNIISELRLLSYTEMRELFPECKIIREKFLFFTKSYIAVRE